MQFMYMRERPAGANATGEWFWIADAYFSALNAFTQFPEKKSLRFTVHNFNEVKYIFIVCGKNHPIHFINYETLSFANVIMTSCGCLTFKQIRAVCGS